MDSSIKQALKYWLIPGGVLLFAAAVLFGAGLISMSGATADLFFYGACLMAVLLAVRFRSSRMVFAAVSIFLAQRALAFFSNGHVSAAGPGRIALEAIAFLVPLNFLLADLVDEQGISWSAAAPGLSVLFVESVFVAVICRPGETHAPALLRIAFLNSSWFHWTRIPQVALLVFATTIAALTARTIFLRKPFENGLLWATATAFAACQVHGVGPLATVYWATAAMILAIVVVENSYALAYNDELTGLPSRRAFNEELLRLQEPYAIAVVDIDHFKNFNDTYGHDTGDEVLRLVASRLARVTGGGKAFRVGGEEFLIVFHGNENKETLPHLENLRLMIEQTVFRVRGAEERRQASRGPDRRNPSKRKATRKSSGQLSVTVSIGVAASSVKWKTPEQVMAAADKALYRAKHGGRNRVEAAVVGARTSRLKRSIA